jgi:hypothetical protein
MGRVVVDSLSNKFGGSQPMESDTNNKWPYVVVVICSLVACIGFALREATLLGWL